MYEFSDETLSGVIEMCGDVLAQSNLFLFLVESMYRVKLLFLEDCDNSEERSATNIKCRITCSKLVHFHTM